MTILVSAMKMLFLGGLSRAGKAAFWPLLSSINGLDQPQNLPNLDWYHDAFEAGDIDENTFLKFVELELTAASWFSYLGRYLNTNHNDLTNFSRLVSKDEYAQRIQRSDTEEEYSNFSTACRTRAFIPTFTTDIKLTRSQQEKLNFDICHLHIIRNPIRMYNEWMATNRVKRSQHIAGRMIKYKAKTLVASVEDTTAQIIIDDFNAHYGQENTFQFENLCVNPLGLLHVMANQVGQNLNVVEKRKLDDARVPRPVADEIKLDIVASDGLSEKKKTELLDIQYKYFHKS